MKSKTVGTALLLVFVGYASWTLGSIHAKRAAEIQCGARMKEACVRLHSSSVTTLPATCDVGDFVFDLTDNKYYMCVSSGKWIYPNYAKWEMTR